MTPRAFAGLLRGGQGTCSPTKPATMWPWQGCMDERLTNKVSPPWGERRSKSKRLSPLPRWSLVRRLRHVREISVPFFWIWRWFVVVEKGKKTEISQLPPERKEKVVTRLSKDFASLSFSETLSGGEKGAGFPKLPKLSRFPAFRQKKKNPVTFQPLLVHLLPVWFSNSRRRQCRRTRTQRAKPNAEEKNQNKSCA